ncbi:MAG: hypothetical protein H6684_06485 [Deltaproteobacteria bacterium]|nr:hypothetical protein [Deltaproteobacteria bacterium]
MPLLDDPEDTVNAPLTAVGAWGLPLASQNDYVSDLRIRNKIINYPGQDLKDFRWGGRWKGVLGGLTYTLVAYHGHQLSPPVPDYVIKEGTPDPDGYTPADVYLRVPRLDVFGFSLDYAFESPIGAVVKFEAAVEPNRQYGVNSFLSAGFSPDNRDTNPWTILDPTAAPGQSPLKADLHYEERHTLNYALEIFRANQWRFINNTSSTITVFRLMQNFYFNPDDINDNKFKLGNPYVREIFADGSSALNENWHIVYAPGYDTTIPANMDTILVWAMFTSYFHGAFTPGVTAIYKPRHVLMIEDASDVFDWEAFEEGSGFVATSFKFAFGNHWRPEVGFNYIFGQDPYYDLGLYRDRDEVYAKVKYQF